MKRLSEINEGVFRNSIIRTSGTGTKRRESSVEYNAVDLGLPSGTLWADRNVGAMNPEEYGGYYQWGCKEDMTNKKCNPEEYPFKIKNDLPPLFSKYNTNDKMETLDLSDDIANSEMGGDWHIPTRKDFSELIVNTEGNLTKVNGTLGMLLKSTKNGNTIFFPAAGYKEGDEIKNKETTPNLWSSTRDYDNCGYALSFSNGYIYVLYRHYGASVRGVKKATK